MPYFYESPSGDLRSRSAQAGSCAGARLNGVFADMVARVIQLKRRSKTISCISDGLAAGERLCPRPLCGTAACLAEVLRRIAVNLERQGLGALAGARVKQACM